MKAAFSYWDSRIAPVFDTTREIQLVECESGKIVASRDLTLSAELPMQRPLQLADLGIETLVCGAISKPMHSMISSYGIQVIPFVAGELPQVVQGWLENRLQSERFIMPGCRRGSLAGGGRKDKSMNRQGRGGGQGAGQGRRQGGQGMGLGNRAAGVAGAMCLCPACGHTEPHQRGVPCMQNSCPKCGATMTRG